MKKKMFIKLTLIIFVLNITLQTLCFTISHSDQGRDDMYVDITSGNRGSTETGIKERKTIAEDVLLLKHLAKPTPDSYPLTSLPLNFTIKKEKEKKDVNTNLLNKLSLDVNALRNLLKLPDNTTPENVIKYLNEPYRVDFSFGIFEPIPSSLKIITPSAENQKDGWKLLGFKTDIASDETIKFIEDHKLG